MSSNIGHALAFTALGGYFLARTLLQSRVQHWRSESDFVHDTDTNSGDTFPDHLIDQSESLFQRYILAKLRAKIGVPVVTQANLESVRRQVYAILMEERPDMRYSDLEFHCTRITTMTFVPSKSDVELSRMLIKDESMWGVVSSWIWGKGPVQSRVDEMLRPRK